MPHSRSLARLLLLCLLTLLLTPLAHADDTSTSTSTSGGGGADLRPLWHTGQTSRYRTVSTRVTTSQLQGQAEPHSSTLQVKTEFTWKVLQANPTGGGTCSLTVDNIVMALAGPDGKPEVVTVDKSPEKLQPIQQLLKALTGAPVTLTVASDGTITQAAGWQSIRSNSGEQGKNLTEKDFIETAWELAPLPGGPANATSNTRWTAPLEIDHEMGSLHAEGTYQFEGVESLASVPVAMINRTSKISFTPDPARLNLPPGTTAHIDLKKSDMRSQIMFDLTRHETAGLNLDRLEVFLLTFTNQGRTIQQAIKQQYNTQVLRITEN